jgi:hypothetical protein
MKSVRHVRKRVPRTTHGLRTRAHDIGKVGRRVIDWQKVGCQPLAGVKVGEVTRVRVAHGE